MIFVVDLATQLGRKLTLAEGGMIKRSLDPDRRAETHPALEGDVMSLITLGIAQKCIIEPPRVVDAGSLRGYHLASQSG